MIILGIDPSQKATGICAWDLQQGPVAVEVVRLSRAGHTQADSIAVLRRLVGDAEWVAAIEKPPPVKRGLRQAPSAAFQHWRDALDLLQRQRAAEQAQRYRKPDVRLPLPQEWRRKLSLPTRGDRDRLKAAAVERVRLAFAPRYSVLARDLSDDEADAVCIAAWLALVVAWEHKIADGAEQWNVPAANLAPTVRAELQRRRRAAKGAA